MDREMDPVAQAELIKEAARIDSTTGRLPENETDPMCDHCGEHNWSTWLIFSGGYDRSRRLCEDCARQVLEWI
jgi:hypothetical protein